MKILKHILYLLFKNYNMVKYCRFRGVKIGEGTKIKSSVNISTEPYLISIGCNCKITGRVNLITHDGGPWVFRSENPNLDVIKKITIGDNVYVGVGATLMPGVNIGNNCVIGAQSVVTKDIPSNSVAVGSPARVIKSLKEYKEKVLSEAYYTKTLTANKKRKFLEKRLKG
tara:strand:- start:1011 stop:1520 length:510 start_codon:yes stop_codon:yes gene_type:complete